ncbi:putative non-LTR retroelement reverse transcriptase related protein, partial [Trifolium medium]|nr:putative non-LTR retroelement reverse transcriptase related protein [Trifolium medium]
VEGGRLRDGGRRGSSWWREIASIREGGGEPWGRWVGDGSDTLFWTDPWVDETPLCERFERLFDLDETKCRTVVEMFSLGWGWKGMLGCGGDS